LLLDEKEGKEEEEKQNERSFPPKLYNSALCHLNFYSVAAEECVLLEYDVVLIENLGFLIPDSGNIFSSSTFRKTDGAKYPANLATNCKLTQRYIPED